MRYCPDDRLNADRCTGCGTCERVCPSAAVRLIDEGIPVFDAGLCIGCGHCGAYCPVNAFGLDPLPEEEGAATAEQFTTLMKLRRTVRLYNDKVPSEEEIDELLSILDWSPTGRNSQGIAVSVFRGRDAVDDLNAPVRRMLGALRSVGIARLAGRLTGTSPYIDRILGGEDILFRSAPAVLFFHVPKSSITGISDGIIAASAVMTHAAAIGMGTMWNGAARKLYPVMRSWRHRTAKGTRLAAVLCVGYPLLRPLWTVPPRDRRVVRNVTEDSAGRSPEACF